MALKVNSLEGNEIADDYIRKSVPKGRFSDTWDVVKSSFGKLVLINIFVLITFVPGIIVMLFRGAMFSTMAGQAPTNFSIFYPHYNENLGYAESINMTTDLLFYSVLIVAGFIASIGLAGASYSIRKLINTHGEFSIKSFFHGIKVCYFNTVMPVTIFMIFFFATRIVGDWSAYVVATGGNKAGSITAYVFVIIATVLAGIYCAWLFAVGTTYRVKMSQLFRNAFVLIIGTPLQTVLMAGLSLIPVWFFMIGGIMRTISYVLFIFLGFSFILVCWTSFTQWAFDMFITPNMKAAQEQIKATKSEKELAREKEEENRRAAGELLAAGKSELIAHPIMPIADGEPSVKCLGLTFSRADITRADGEKQKLGEDLAAYEEQHKNDPVYVEYNRLFAEREKALQSDNKKGKKGKKISSDNLLK